MAVRRLCSELALCIVVGVSCPAADLFVATSGDDRGPGTLEQPFRTLVRARDAARELKAAPAPPGAVNIFLRGGVYPLTATFALDERDSGTAAGPVVFRPYLDEEVRLLGGQELPAGAFQPVTDPAILRRLAPGVRERLVQVDLRALGITDYGVIGPRGFRRPYAPGPLELCFNDEVMQIARWPNAGLPLARMGQVIDPGADMRNESGKAPVRYDSTQGGVFTYLDDRVGRWEPADDIWVSGIFAWGFSDDTLRVRKIAPEKRQIETTGPAFYSIMNHRPFCGWFALNVVEEIDVPGEYAVDRQRGVLYFLPPGPLAGARLQVSLMTEPLIALEGASHVVFERLILECTRGTGVYIERGDHNEIRGCTLRNLGIMGVQFGRGIEPAEAYSESFTGKPVPRQLGSWHEHVWSNNDFDSEAGREHRISSCDIYNTGAGGVHLSGGNRVTLVPAGNAVVNCHLHHCGRLDPAYKAAVNFDGVGNRLAHCLIDEHPHLAIYLQGNDQTIEDNEITRCAQRVDDMGALYTGMDPTQLGNVIRGNFWHHNSSEVSENHPVVYFDSPGGHGATIEGNVFYRNPCGWGDIMLNQGAQGFQVNNNLFIGARRAIRLEEVSPAQAVGPLFGDARRKLLQFIDLSKPPYSLRYPGMANFRQPGWYDTRKNTVRRNVVVGCESFYTGHPEAQDNLVTAEDPGFVDAANADFRLRADSSVFRQVPGFKPIPVETIGLQVDEFRKTLPPRLPEIECDKEYLMAGDAVHLRATQAGVQVRYTLDGTEPNRRSPLGSGPIVLPEGRIPVRARAFGADPAVLGPGNARSFEVRRAVPVHSDTQDGWIRSAQAVRLNDVILDKEGRIGHCEGGDYVVFGPYDFGAATCNQIEAVVGIDPQYARQKMHLRLDSKTGPTVGTVVWESTGGFLVFGTQRAPLQGLGGTHYLYLVFEGGVGICNLERFRFLAGR